MKMIFDGRHGADPKYYSIKLLTESHLKFWPTDNQGKIDPKLPPIVKLKYWPHPEPPDDLWPEWPNP